MPKFVYTGGYGYGSGDNNLNKSCFLGVPSFLTSDPKNLDWNKIIHYMSLDPDQKNAYYQLLLLENTDV